MGTVDAAVRSSQLQPGRTVSTQCQAAPPPRRHLIRIIAEGPRVQRPSTRREHFTDEIQRCQSVTAMLHRWPAADCSMHRVLLDTSNLSDADFLRSARCRSRVMWAAYLMKVCSSWLAGWVSAGMQTLRHNHAQLCSATSEWPQARARARWKSQEAVRVRHSEHAEQPATQLELLAAPSFSPHHLQHVQSFSRWQIGR
jgi:hypothetical protein